MFLWRFLNIVLLLMAPGLCAAQMPTDVKVPTLYLIGDSTVKNRTKGQLSWGDPLVQHFFPFYRVIGEGSGRRQALIGVDMSKESAC